MPNPRQTIVQTAQFWFDSARKAQQDGKMCEALLCMENAFNHTENALGALLRASTFKDEPPVSGRESMTLDAMRAKLDALHS